MKILTVLGTRPEIIRLSEILKRLDKTFNHVLVHTGQNYDYELNQVFFDDLKTREPDYFLGAAGNTVAETIGSIISGVDKILEKEKPDAFLVLGDTNSSLSAYAAKRRHIPVFHIEAGNRCFDARVPEELNRKIIDHISDVNLAYSHNALGNLLREGLPPDRNFFLGSPLFEVFQKQKQLIDASTILSKLDLKKNEYFLASLHREENVDTLDNLKLILESLSKVGNEYGVPVLLSTHPRTKNKISQFNLQIPRNILVQQPFGFIDYNALQVNAKCVFSDSGSINEEASILGIKAVNIRNAHERPEASVCGVTPMASIASEMLLECTNIVLEKESEPLIPDGYDIPDVSWRVVNHILSLTEYVKRKNFW